jgi:tetratricopeptide (TPR) repeat protein
MGPNRWTSAAAFVMLGLLALTLPAAAQEHELASGKVTISTASTDALQLFLQGRDLAEKIRGTDAREYYQQAVAIDPNFAFAYLALANTAPSAKEFFESLERAVALVDHASEGERLMILAADAAAKGDVESQREHLTRLVESFPADERAHTALANYYYGRQEWDQAIAEYAQATEINPDYSPPYNTLGYAQRSLGNYSEAEKAFQQYIELIPDEPNPYDSYAELLMKMGRFEESIANYEKALSKNPNFVASYVGIGNDQTFLGKTDEARATFAKLHDEVARTDGERRAALFWTAASYVHDANYATALETLRAMQQIAEASGDLASMAGDFNVMGNVQLHSGDHAGALASYRDAAKAMDAADVPDRVKENTRRNLLYFEARAAIAADDLETARAKAMEYGQAAQAHQIPFELRRSHELLGMIALHQEDYGKAVEELAQANQQDPLILYVSAKAHQGAGDQESAREMAERAANFNGLNFNYAFVRAKAAKMLEEHG